MNDEQKKRLKEIKKDGKKPVSIGYSDLILLVRYDDELVRLLKQIFQPAICSDNQEQPLADSNAEYLATQLPEEPNSAVLSSDAESHNVAMNPESAVPSDADRFYKELQPALQLLALVQQDSDLNKRWLRADESGSAGLLRLVATAAQWDQLLELWDLLAGRCKANQRKASDEERQLLESCLAFYNLTLRSRQALLITPKPTVAFDHTQHIRATPQGEILVSVWLPGLTNAAGVIQKKPLVATE